MFEESEFCLLDRLLIFDTFLIPLTNRINRVHHNGKSLVTQIYVENLKLRFDQTSLNLGYGAAPQLALRVKQVYLEPRVLYKRFPFASSWVVVVDLESKIGIYGEMFHFFNTCGDVTDVEVKYRHEYPACVIDNEDLNIFDFAIFYLDNILEFLHIWHTIARSIHYVVLGVRMLLFLL